MVADGTLSGRGLAALALLLVGSVAFAESHSIRALEDQIEKAQKMHEGRFGKRPPSISYGEQRGGEATIAEIASELNEALTRREVGELREGEDDRRLLILETRLKELRVLFETKDLLELVKRSREELGSPIPSSMAEDALEKVVKSMESGRDYLDWLPGALTVGDRNLALDQISLLGEYLKALVREAQAAKNRGKTMDQIRTLAAEAVAKKTDRLWDISLDPKNSRLPARFLRFVSDERGGKLLLSRARLVTAGSPAHFETLASLVFGTPEGAGSGGSPSGTDPFAGIAPAEESDEARRKRKFVKEPPEYGTQPPGSGDEPPGPR